MTAEEKTIARYLFQNKIYKAEMALTNIINAHHLQAGGFKTPKDLENILFSLADDEILTVTGMIPDPAKKINAIYTAEKNNRVVQ
jgi:hypothetical protein